MQITFKLLNGKNILIECEANRSIDEIKQKIQDEEGLLVENQRFIWNGDQLDDGRTLSDYNIVQNTTVHLVMRVRETNE